MGEGRATETDGVVARADETANEVAEGDARTRRMSCSESALRRFSHPIGRFDIARGVRVRARRAARAEGLRWRDVCARVQVV